MATLIQLQTDHDRCLAAATALLGQPARAVVLDWTLEWHLQRTVRRVRALAHTGDEKPAWSQQLIRFSSDDDAYEVAAGMQCYLLETPHGPIRLVQVHAPHVREAPSHLYHFWAVAETDYVPLYRYLRKAAKEKPTQIAPVMRGEDRTRLWNNTIGFLTRDATRLREFGIPVRRGVLLLGEPGNGKTTACRWLRDECHAANLEWQTVTQEELDSANSPCAVREVFALDGPGIILFDDINLPLRPGLSFHSARSMFLAGLDGIDTSDGVVFVFTSNERALDLDPAFRRPGRIDLITTFARPDLALRRELLERFWHAELVAGIPVDQVLAATDGMSFAEMEELKKLLAVHYLETGQCDWQHAWQTYHAARQEEEPATKIGFRLGEGRVVARS